MKIIGMTVNKIGVVSGIFDLFSTNGIPLYVLFEWCKSNDYIPCWNSFYLEASNNGWKHETILSRLKENMLDVWDESFIEYVIAKLNPEPSTK